MDNKHEYLTSLLEWTKKVESQIEPLKKGNAELGKWQSKLADLNTLLILKLKQDEISDEEISDVQKKSQGLIYLLSEMLDKPRVEHRYIAPGKHTLPPLPYPYNALEPYISEKIMRLHHDKHHQSYVDGLNKAEIELYKQSPEQPLLKHWLREQAFNGSGHYLHTVFWSNMSPNGGGSPKGALSDQIDRDFGSFQHFKNLFTKAATSVEGVGWAILVWEPRAARLGIQTAEKHQMFSLWDVVPLLVVDVWEHAYYLQYETKRGEYVKNWWEVVNWEDVQKRYNKAKQLVWPLY